MGMKAAAQSHQTPPPATKSKHQQTSLAPSNQIRNKIRVNPRY
jgi:hypothetical protein